MDRMEQVFRDYFHTFYQALKTVKKFRCDCKMSVWLCQIAKHVWQKDCRKKNRQIALPMDVIELELQAANRVEDELLKSEARNEYICELLENSLLARLVIF